MKLKITLAIILVLIVVSFQSISFAETDSNVSNLEKYLPTEKELEEITYRPIWNYIDKNTNFDENSGVIDSVSVLLRDITRFYEPIHYKFKVPTVMIEITEYQDKIKLNQHWNESRNITIQEMATKSYLKGSPNEFTDCFFNYSNDGAVTVCIFENIIIKSTISDKYGEHYIYNTKEIRLDEYETTTRIMGDIIQSISDEKKIENEDKLYKILQNKKSNNEKNNDLKSSNMENADKFGVQKFSCIKDEFGLITISGQYNNDGIKKDKVSVIVSFLDRKGIILGESIANLFDIKEFENKRFIGNTLSNDMFYTCMIEIQ
jgi:hypothetical protein